MIASKGHDVESFGGRRSDSWLILFFEIHLIYWAHKDFLSPQSRARALDRSNQDGHQDAAPVANEISGLRLQLPDR